MTKEDQPEVQLTRFFSTESFFNLNFNIGVREDEESVVDSCKKYFPLNKK